MNLQSEEENWLRWYLLGAVSPEEETQIERQLGHGEPGNHELRLAEEDLIDDYARGTLRPEERQLFEQNFLTTMERRQRLLMAQAAVRYAGAMSKARGRESAPQPLTVTEDRRPGWWRSLLTPGLTPFWRGLGLAVCTGLVLGIGLWIWPAWRDREEDRAEVATAENDLNRAYRSQRPLEARITGFDHAPYLNRLGGEPENDNYLLIDRIEGILREAVRERPTAATQHALGRFYLAQKQFDRAEELFQTALQTEPNNARIHSDLGVALFEKWDRGPRTAESDEVRRRSLEHLARALTLDGSSLEARFNLALLYQRSDQIASAREEWLRYLTLDPDSPWAEEVKTRLKN